MAGISTAIGEVRPPSDLSHRDGRRQGRYVLGELLGRGGMAEVFSGFVIGSHGFQKPVAIKRLLPELANDHVFVERLIGEAKLLVGMQHGNIVSVLDLARDGDDVFLVMEYVDGPSLRQLLKARGPRLLPLGVSSYIVQNAAAGLEFAHVRPGGAVIHADISPSNLLLTTSGEVRVADFGIARREGGLVGVVEGKWAYMAPEQARGDNLTPRSDVFALGVVLYELITGQHPLGRQVGAEERDSGPIRVVPPRIVNPAVPAGLDAICMRALAETARDRYPSMQSMIDAIMDERFANQWRDGANELAHAIREVGASGAVPSPTVGPRTQHTDRPVTIVTRSLISQPQRVTPPSLLDYQGLSQPTTGRPDLDTNDVQTDQRELSDATGMITQPGARGSVQHFPQMAALLAKVEPPVRASSAMLSPELASVHGGATVTGSSAVDLRDVRGSNRWTVAVLGIAALIGIAAAVAIQLAPTAGGDELAPVAPRPVMLVSAPAAAPAAPATAPAASPVVEAAPILEPTVPTVTEPAPIAVTPVPVAIASKPAVAAKRAAKSTKATKRSAAATSSGEAILRVGTYNAVWAWVYVGNQPRQEVPDARFKLAPGTYTVRLKNTDLEVTRTCTVTLEAGQVKSLKVEMEEGGCDTGR